jgi:hypothetical protein
MQTQAVVLFKYIHRDKKTKKKEANPTIVSYNVVKCTTLRVHNLVHFENKFFQLSKNNLAYVDATTPALHSMYVGRIGSKFKPSLFPLQKLRTYLSNVHR